MVPPDASTDRGTQRHRLVQHLHPTHPDLLSWVEVRPRECSFGQIVSAARFSWVRSLWLERKDQDEQGPRDGSPGAGPEQRHEEPDEDGQHPTSTFRFVEQRIEGDSALLTGPREGHRDRHTAS